MASVHSIIFAPSANDNDAVVGAANTTIATIANEPSTSPSPTPPSVSGTATIAMIQPP